MFMLGGFFLLLFYLCLFFNIFLTKSAFLKVAPDLPQPLLPQGTVVCSTMAPCRFTTQAVPSA